MTERKENQTIYTYRSAVCRHLGRAVRLAVVQLHIVVITVVVVDVKVGPGDSGPFPGRYCHQPLTHLTDSVITWVPRARQGTVRTGQVTAAPCVGRNDKGCELRDYR